MGFRRGYATSRYTQPCNCVLRSIFRVCYARFRECEAKQQHVSTVRLDICVFGGRSRSFVWGRKDEEFCADFHLIAKRTLSELEWRIFRFHYLIGAEWNFCCRRLKMDRGIFFHHVYRIQQKLGRTFRELRPYALFPLDEYFSGTIQPVPRTGDGSLPIGGRHALIKRPSFPKVA